MTKLGTWLASTGKQMRIQPKRNKRYEELVASAGFTLKSIYISSEKKFKNLAVIYKCGTNIYSSIAQSLMVVEEETASIIIHDYISYYIMSTL